jgi:predicted dehydrogenase
MERLEKGITRRTFLGQAASVVAGATMGTTALSYGRILGANDRVSLGIVGMGRRGIDHLEIIAQIKDSKNVEPTAVCDLWKPYRERAVAAVEKAHGRAPRAFEYMEDMLALKDIDGVMIATPEHQHAVQMKMAAEAGKHIYVEKSMANVLGEAKAARDAVLARPNLIVQVGTQHRSEPYPIAARDLIKTGVLGELNKIEVVWNYNMPRWRGRKEVKLTKAEDIDWQKFLLTKPNRPFDPQLYWEYRLYREFSSGIPDGLWSHAIDLIHFFTDDYYPSAAVAHGGVFAWHDGRENPDTFQALLEYPKGFLVSISTGFGNDSPSFTRYMGKKATLTNIGGEGSPRYQLVEEGGNHEDDPDIESKRASRYVTLHGNDKLPPTYIDDNVPYHMNNWLDAMRSGKQPSAPVQAGFAHSVACMMTDMAYRQGKRVYWDRKNELIVDQPATS